MEKAYYKSPIGILEIICNDNELISLQLSDKTNLQSTENDFIKNIKIQLNEYFLEKRKNFNIKINPAGTHFQKQVWQELQNIPYGTTKSYSEIAIKIGNKNAQRAVGSACNKNPMMIIIPCHRVISKSGDLGEFAYGKFIKQKLLKLEDYADII